MNTENTRPELRMFDLTDPVAQHPVGLMQRSACGVTVSDQSARSARRPAS
ncbi:MAG: hypothetical protein ABJD68_18080 [Nakamurella sp.]